MAAGSDIDRVWELMEKISICMLTTDDGGRIRSRPMAAFVRREQDAIYFLADAHHHKDEEIPDNPNVGLAFADGQKFVSVTGHAAVSRDQARIRELWGPSAKAWWNSPDDPNIRLLTVKPDDAEFWEARARSSAPSRWRRPPRPVAPGLRDEPQGAGCECRAGNARSGPFISAQLHTRCPPATWRAQVCPPYDGSQFICCGLSSTLRTASASVRVR